LPFIPVGDEETHEIIPGITYALIFLNVVVFIFMYNMPADVLVLFIRDFAVIPKELFSTDLQTGFVPEWATLLTSNFMHGGIGHLLGNMLFVFIFADNIEAAFGPVRYILFCIIAGMLSSFIDAATIANLDIPTLGYSGIVSPILGAYWVLYSKAKVHLLTPAFFYIYCGSPFSFAIKAKWVIPLQNASVRGL